MSSCITVPVKKLDEIFIKLITQTLPCNYFIEAGAFQGETSRLVQSLLPNAEVYAFEANKYNYDYFKPQFNNCKVKYINVAISDKNDTVIFKVQKKLKGKPVDKIRGNNSILLRTEKEVDYENIPIQSVSLDNYFKNKIKENDSVALWIDLEGVAYQALQGCLNILKQIYVIKIEVENYRYWENQKLDTDIIKFLNAHGFFEFVKDIETPTQYNIIFCKQNIIEDIKLKELIK